MHYIRFLKLPSLASGKPGSSRQLSSRITITTDLGESFLCCDLELVVVLLEHHGGFSTHNRKKFLWKAGMRHLDISWMLQHSIHGPASLIKWPCRLEILCASEDKQPTSFSCLLQEPGSTDDWGLIGNVVGITSDTFSPVKFGSGEKRVSRSFQTLEGTSVVIWEESGESIARHVWDAGLLLSAHLHNLSRTHLNSMPKMPLLSRCLSRKETKVLELGAGCGIVGITLATCFDNVEVVMTDLPEAEDIAVFNITQNVQSGRRLALTYSNLDWSTTLDDRWAADNFDLIVAADVTYNSDVVPDLVKTVASLIEHNSGTMFLVAMKVRHDSEAIFFELMKQKSLAIVERLTLPLPVLAEDDQTIEMYLFGQST